MECPAVHEQDLWSALYVFFVFVVFFSGIFLGVLISPFQGRELERSHARPVAAKGGPRRDGKERSVNLLAGVTALIVGFGVAALDHFKEPLFLNWPSTRSAISSANGSPGCREGADVRPDVTRRMGGLSQVGSKDLPE
jgi:hypothetical protein